MIFFHGTLLENVPNLLDRGIEPTEGWGGAGTVGVFLSGTPDGALYWAKLAYQRNHGGKMEIDRFDREHAQELDNLVAILAVEIPSDSFDGLWGDEEQYEDVDAEIHPQDWRGSLREIGDIRFDGPIPPQWIVEVIQPSKLDEPE